ncbi:MAG TPA: rod shape-determining protein MreC [Patescibacteria group bacterium]|nr:rod shape-determining protein MreC [Patescibacteria group bacterium]
MYEDVSVTKQLSFVSTLLVVSFLLMVLDGFGLLSPFRRATEYVSIPVQFGLYRSYQSVRENVVVVFEIQKQHEQIRFLESEINRLHGEVVRINELEDENKALRAQLSATNPITFSLLPAKTLGGDRYLSVDKGSDQSVKEGMVVISENVVLGKVKEVYPRFSTVQLITDPDTRLAVEILLQEGIAKGILLGQFQSGLLLDQVLQEEKIEEGNLVVTSGENLEYPKGLLVGRIAHIQKEEAEVFQKAEVKPLLDIREVRTVFIML